jgi:hypothetical protein
VKITFGNQCLLTEAGHVARMGDRRSGYRVLVGKAVKMLQRWHLGRSQEMACMSSWRSGKATGTNT